MSRRAFLTGACCLALAASPRAQDQPVKPPATRTQVVGYPDLILTPWVLGKLYTVGRPAVDTQRSRPEVLLSEMLARYSGHFVIGRDLDVY
jgi:hypothetical protein